MVVEIQDFGESAISYDVALWIPASDFLGRRWALRRYIWEEFRAADVRMTYPHLNIHVQNDAPQASEGPAGYNEHE